MNWFVLLLTSQKIHRKHGAMCSSGEFFLSTVGFAEGRFSSFCFCQKRLKRGILFKSIKTIFDFFAIHITQRKVIGIKVWPFFNIFLLFLDVPMPYNLAFTPSVTEDYLAVVSWAVPGDFRVSHYRIMTSGVGSFDFIYRANSTSPTSVTVYLNRGAYYHELFVYSYEDNICGSPSGYLPPGIILVAYSTS